ncbi:glycine betaine/proline transport system permease protein [Ruaniaceae bacterium KH17]|nr:glycine betaine/proline transport system permease protein [Ruaniaceae bacterium KH17]
MIFHIPFGEWIASAINWMTVAWQGFFNWVQAVLDGMDTAISGVLHDPPLLFAIIAASAIGFLVHRWIGAAIGAVLFVPISLFAGPEWTTLALLVALAFAAKGWKLALGSLLGLLFIDGVNQWGNAMDTLSLVLVASLVAVIVGVPLGILAASFEPVSRVVRPILDFLQTMPALAYLVPFVVLFRVGVVPAIVATILFSLPPSVRLTELGIRQVDSEVVEAGHAFGATPLRILGQIQLPLARTTIMAGVNQVIMLALSMVVIAGMVGAGGLGNDVVQALQRLRVGLGFEAGVAVVILAIYLDRVTAAFGNGGPKLAIAR